MVNLLLVLPLLLLEAEIHPLFPVQTTAAPLSGVDEGATTAGVAASGAVAAANRPARAVTPAASAAQPPGTTATTSTAGTYKNISAPVVQGEAATVAAAPPAALAADRTSLSAAAPAGAAEPQDSPYSRTKCSQPAAAAYAAANGAAADGIKQQLLHLVLLPPVSRRLEEKLEQLSSRSNVNTTSIIATSTGRSTSTAVNSNSSDEKNTSTQEGGDSSAGSSRNSSSGSSRDIDTSRSSNNNNSGGSSSNNNRGSSNTNKSRASSSNSSSWASEAGDDLSSSEKEVVMSVGLLLLLLIVAACLFISLAAKRMKQLVLQVPLVATLLGLLLGALLQQHHQLQQQRNSSSSLRSILALKEEVFFVLLLPPIVFQGGLELAQNPFGFVFAENFGSVLWLAVGATACSCLLIGTHMLGAGLLLPGVSLTPRRAFAVGALISSTDPVAVLSAFRDLHAKLLIHVLVFGESLLNDAVTLVLYRAIADEEADRGFAAAVASFIFTFLASTVLGFLTGAVAALVYKHIDWDEEGVALEVALLLLFPWLSYLIADGCGGSGIVSICFCGISMGKYAFANLSEKAQTASRAVFGAFALLTECLAFVFLGLAPFSFDLLPFEEAGLFLAGGLAAVVAARALSVYLTCFLMNFFRGHKRLSIKEQHAIALCGLRGTVAFALAERAHHDFGGREGKAILTFTLVVALVSVLLITPALLFALRPLGIFLDESDGSIEESPARELPLNNTNLIGNAGTDVMTQQQQQNDITSRAWYLTPFFASPCRSRRQTRDRNEEVELQHIATEDKEQLQEREQLRRRGNEVYVNLPHNTECTAVDLAPAADLVGGGDLLQQQAGFLDQREQTQ
ncbi:sodium/hydrogen exchanger, putative [Eimeria maxima]|uniref:Sodium/hydrogen exchanger, putative n=1 Tax=Eimeria maxima TaxID=5804 RepID=U6M311_EIMMA|nr:sodium/hydrogen exchanger, putative [Eimeria maxima]CDJ58416.1 sodium/hydrogen exchanger, putative [Eimeria maxima]